MVFNIGMVWVNCLLLVGLVKIGVFKMRLGIIFIIWCGGVYCIIFDFINLMNVGIL